ncbi:MAG: NUDIX hydrolase [Chloroflexi bacterium]|nr:NUDIX hydrolase [Chloroflexota bacterium]
MKTSSWKAKLARLMHIRGFQWLMRLGVFLTVPRYRVGVGVVLFDDRDRVLLLYHVFHPQMPWGVPGGWLNRREDPPAGALRELKEETGLTAVLEKALYVEYDPHPQHIGILYVGRVIPGHITLNNEILEARWFDLDNLPLLLAPGSRHAIETATSTLLSTGVAHKQHFAPAVPSKSTPIKERV